MGQSGGNLEHGETRHQPTFYQAQKFRFSSMCLARDNVSRNFQRFSKKSETHFFKAPKFSNRFVFKKTWNFTSLSMTVIFENWKNLVVWDSLNAESKRVSNFPVIVFFSYTTYFLYSRIFQNAIKLAMDTVQETYHFFSKQAAHALLFVRKTTLH